MVVFTNISESEKLECVSQLIHQIRGFKMVCAFRWIGKNCEVMPDFRLVPPLETTKEFSKITQGLVQCNENPFWKWFVQVLIIQKYNFIYNALRRVWRIWPNIVCVLRSTYNNDRVNITIEITHCHIHSFISQFNKLLHSLKQQRQ